MHVSVIRNAMEWMTRLQRESFVLPNPLTCADLEQSLGRSMAACRLWRRNWRNRLYLVEMSDGSTLIAKQLFVPSDQQLVQEYEQLRTLCQFDMPEWRVPRPMAMMPKQRVYLMEYVTGRSIHDLFWDRHECANLAAACERAGLALAHLHNVRQPELRPVPIDDLTDDLMRMPGGLSVRSRRIIEGAHRLMNDQPAAIGPLYLDYKADNVLVCDQGMTLIDPPQERCLGLLLWDCATFRSSIRWMLWKCALSWRSRRGELVRQSLQAFDQAYLQNAPDRSMPKIMQKLLLHLLELQHVGQMMAYQIGKLRLVNHWHNPLMLSGRFTRELSSAIIWLPVLWMQRNWILRLLRKSLMTCREEYERRPTSVESIAMPGLQFPVSSTVMSVKAHQIQSQ